MDNSEPAGPIQFHIFIGTLLVVVALVALILSIVARHLVGMVAAEAFLALLIFAWLSGAAFLASQTMAFH